MIRRLWQSLVLVLTLKCEKAEEIRLRAGYGEATRVERLAEWLHRAICGWCRTAARQMHKLDTALDLYRQRMNGFEDEAMNLPTEGTAEKNQERS